MWEGLELLRPLSTDFIISSLESIKECENKIYFHLCSQVLIIVNHAAMNDCVCAVPYGNHGCHGGNSYLAYQYVIDAEGVDLEMTYPYKAMVSSK